MPSRTAENRAFRAAAKGAVIGLIAAFSVRLADTPLGILVWTVCAVSIGAVASVLHELAFEKEQESAEKPKAQDSQLPLVVTSTQLKRSETVLLEVPGVGEVEIALQPKWRDGGMLRLTGLLPDNEVVVARLRVIDD
jgi:hypothetical protein